MGSARAGSTRATSRHAKRKRSRSSSRNRSSKRARSHRSGSSRRRGTKSRSMRAGSKGKSRGSKGRALIKRSSSGRSSLASHRLKGKVTKVTKTASSSSSSSKKEKKPPKHAIGAFFYFIINERAIAKKQRIQLPPVGEWTKAIAAKWRSMSPEEQAPFQEKARQDKIRYAHEVSRYNARKLKSGGNTSPPPQSGFLAFLEEYRKGSHGDQKDVVKLATVAWNKTSKAKKRLYQKRAERGIRSQ